MSNTPNTPASVASRLTDEEIETNARGVLNMAWFSNYEKAGCSPEKIAAVLRDYVQLRKLANEVKAKVDFVNKMPSAPLDGGIENQKINGEKLCAKITAFAEISRLLAEAGKGEEK